MSLGRGQDSGPALHEEGKENRFEASGCCCRIFCCLISSGLCSLQTKLTPGTNDTEGVVEGDVINSDSCFQSVGNDCLNSEVKTVFPV